MELASYLDHWAIVRSLARYYREGTAADKNSWRRLTAVARVADPDPLRGELRKSIDNRLDDHGYDPVSRLLNDKKALAAQPVQNLRLLAQLLDMAEDTGAAEDVLKLAWRIRPDDFWVCSELGRLRGKDAIRFGTAAVALRPRSADLILISRRPSGAKERFMVFISSR